LARVFDTEAVAKPDRTCVIGTPAIEG
jgi:hypothetical protein